MLAFFGLRTEAQQDPQFSQNMSTKLFVNPAFAGMNDGICVNLLGRQQWTGFEGRPETYLFNAHGTFTIPLINLRSGGGISMVGDQLGQMHFFGVKGMYSAHIPLTIIGSQPGHLGIGMSFGLLQFAVGNNWRSLDPYYNDPTINDQQYQLSAFDMDFGIYYRTKDIYFGISTMHLNAGEFEASGDALFEGQTADWKTTFSMARHYYVMGGYDFEIPNFNLIMLKPSVFVKTDITSSQIDLNMIAEYNHFLWGGVTYRYNDAFVALAGVNIGPQYINKGNLRVGYSYDITTSRIARGSNGSHELSLQYCLKLRTQPPVQKHKTVRFL